MTTQPEYQVPESVVNRLNDRPEGPEARRLADAAVSGFQTANVGYMAVISMPVTLASSLE
jgi:hypothetical protein